MGLRVSARRRRRWGAGKVQAPPGFGVGPSILGFGRVQVFRAGRYQGVQPPSSTHLRPVPRLACSWDRSWQEVLPRDAWTPQTGHPPWGQSLRDGPLRWCRAGRVGLGRSQGLSFQTPSLRRRELLAWLPPPPCPRLGLGAGSLGPRQALALHQHPVSPVPFCLCPLCCVSGSVLFDGEESPFI